MTARSPGQGRIAAAAGVVSAVLLVGVVGCHLADPDRQAEAVPSARAPLPATASPPGPSTSTSADPDSLCHPPLPLAPAELADVGGRTGNTTPVSLPASTPAAPALSLLSGAILATRCDRDVAGSVYDFVQLQQWAADTTIRDGRATSSIVLFQEERWRAADGSGRVASTRYPGTRPPPSGPDSSDVRHQPGELLAVMPATDPAKRAEIPPPIATDPANLAEQFNTAQPRRMGPQSVLRAYADLAGWHTTTLQQRRAILTVLANTDGLRYHPAVADWAGRTGVGVSVDSNQGDTRDLVILHPATGQLLAYEHAVLGNRTQRTAAPRVENYVLYLAHSTTDSADVLPR
jgi:hypothetical protein